MHVVDIKLWIAVSPSFLGVFTSAAYNFQGQTDSCNGHGTSCLTICTTPRWQVGNAEPSEDHSQLVDNELDAIYNAMTKNIDLKDIIDQDNAKHSLQAAHP